MMAASDGDENARVASSLGDQGALLGLPEIVDRETVLREQEDMAKFLERPNGPVADIASTSPEITVDGPSTDLPPPPHDVQPASTNTAVETSSANKAVQLPIDTISSEIVTSATAAPLASAENHLVSAPQPSTSPAADGTAAVLAAETITRSVEVAESMQTHSATPNGRDMLAKLLPIKGTNLPDLPHKMIGTSWMRWVEKKLKVAKQMVSERFGGADATVDEELEEQVKELISTQTAYRNILRLALSFNDHLYGMVQAQRQLSQSFGELSMHQPDLNMAFSNNHESQKALYKNGEALIGALQFFTDNLHTLVFTTMEDTLESWRCYEEKRIEFDAERHSVGALRETTKNERRLKAAEEEFEQHRQRFSKARASVKAKLDLLGANKTRVMQKQLQLFYDAMVAYFSGNQVALDQILSESHVQRAQLAEVTHAGNAWLNKLHNDMAVTIAPTTPPVSSPFTSTAPAVLDDQGSSPSK